MDKKINEILVDELVRMKENQRDENIINIGKSDNLIAFKRVSREIEQRGLDFDVSTPYLSQLLKDGVKKIESLLGDDENFTILPQIKEKGIVKYFEYVYNGRKDILKKESFIETDRKKIEELEQKIQKYKDNGNFKQAEKFRQELYAYENAEEFQKKAEADLKELEKMGVSPKDKEYKDIQRQQRKYKRVVENRTESTKYYDFVVANDYDLREFVGGLFFNRVGSTRQGEDRFLKDHYGNTKIDFEHVLLMYEYMRANQHPKLSKIEGLLYYIALETFYVEVKQLKEATRNGAKLEPSFDTGPDSFTWKRFNQYLRKYMLYFTQPVGYNCYYIEPANITQLGYLMAKDAEELDYTKMMDKYIKAKEILNNQESGLFLNFLSKEKENDFIPHILSVDFPLWQMTGEYVEDLENDFLIRHNRFESEQLSNMYNRLIKPYCLDLIGSILYNQLYNIENLVDKDMVHIYYIAPQRIGIAIRADLSQEVVSEIFGNAQKMFKEIEKPTLEGIVYGGYL